MRVDHVLHMLTPFGDWSVRFINLDDVAFEAQNESLPLAVYLAAGRAKGVIDE